MISQANRRPGYATCLSTIRSKPFAPGFNFQIPPRKNLIASFRASHRRVEKSVFNRFLHFASLGDASVEMTCTFRLKNHVNYLCSLCPRWLKNHIILYRLLRRMATKVYFCLIFRIFSVFSQFVLKKYEKMLDLAADIGYIQFSQAERCI